MVVGWYLSGQGMGKGLFSETSSWASGGLCCDRCAVSDLPRRVQSGELSDEEASPGNPLVHHSFFDPLVARSCTSMAIYRSFTSIDRRRLRGILASLASKASLPPAEKGGAGTWKSIA